MSIAKPLCAFFRHHKCAGTWMHNICKKACEHMGFNYAYLPQDITNNSNAPITSKIINEFIADNSINFFSYGNTPMWIAKDLPNYKGFNIIRDPRDMVVSAYFSHLYSHNVTMRAAKGIGEFRSILKELSMEDGLLAELEKFMPHVFKMMNDWDYSMSNVFETKFEDITVEPAKIIIDIFNFLGLLNRFIDENSLLNIINKNSFEKLSGGRNINVEDVKSHYRKGVAGDWKNYFNETHKKRFKDLHSDLLMKLNYEKNNNW